MALLMGYQRTWLRGDLVAGVTVTAIAIPESLGYANIAGLPVQTGLYCALVPAVLFALVASSRQLVVGADSATAALVAAGAGAVVASSSDQYPATVAVLGLITAGILLLMAAALPPELVHGDARVVLIQAWVFDLRGQHDEASALGAAVERADVLPEGPQRDGFATLESGSGMRRATFLRGDVSAQVADGRRVLELEGDDSAFRALTTLMVGMGVRSIYCKLDIGTRREAVAVARRRGVL